MGCQPRLEKNLVLRTSTLQSFVRLIECINALVPAAVVDKDCRPIFALVSVSLAGGTRDRGGVVDILRQ